MKIKAIAALATVGLAVSITGSVHAQTNFVQNGDFTLVTGGTNGQLGKGSGLTATGWTNAGYNFLFNSASEANTGSGLELWGPGSKGGGSVNGFVDSPTGTNFIGADGAYQVGALSQSITGLTVGDYYDLTFDSAAAQQEGFSGLTTDFWTVGLGTTSLSNPTQVTTTVNVPNHGFINWTTQNMGFTANSSTEVLSFLATGTPSGTPPFALLDGVSLTVVPEPSPFIAMFIGALGLGAILVKRARGKKNVA